MTQAEYQKMRVESDMDATQAELAAAMEAVERRTKEMAQAVEFQYDLSCHASNVSAAASHAAVLAAKLAGLRSALRMIEEIQNG